MKNVNFDSLTNIKAPEQWIENALNIPKTVGAEKAKPLFFIKHARTLAAVASLVFVSVISIVLFLSNDSVTPQIEPNSKETKPTISSVQTDYSTQSKEKPSDKTNSKQDNKVKNPTENYEEIEPPESTQPQRPTSGSGDTEKPTKPTTPIGPPKPTEPEVRPPEVEPETEGADPTEPCLPPSEWIDPTEPEWDPSAPGDPPKPSTPTAPPWVTPTESPFSGICLTGSVSLDIVEITDKIYCMIYDSNGRLVGDSNLYSSQHRAYFTIATQENRINLTYDVPNGLITKHGTYSYYFYNRDDVILYYGTKYI